MLRITNTSLTLLLLCSVSSHALQKNLLDEQRQRPIPISITYPDVKICSTQAPCKLAILSSGYGIPHTEYQFMVSELARSGFAVVTVQHQLKTDPSLSVIQPYLKTRARNWQRGTENLTFVLKTLTPIHPEIDFNTITLVGHSNGGDIGAWFSKKFPQKVSMLITLDHRRVPLPRINTIQVLSIRGSDFPADANVLYTPAELQELRACVVTIPKSRHNDMTDSGPNWLKSAISKKISNFINNAQCG